MQVQFKPGYGLLAHNESIDGIADILKCFLREDEQLLFSFYERNIDFIHESDKDFILKGKYLPIPIGHCLGKNLFPIGMVQITLPQN